jgi:hypothetical protein
MGKVKGVAITAAVVIGVMVAITYFAPASIKKHVGLA